MTGRILPFRQIGTFDESQPYFPFPVAVERNILQEPEALARPVDIPPGIQIRSGKIPNNKQAGLLLLGQGRFGAFDLAAAELDPTQVQIMPAPKSAVDDDGEIKREGVVVLETSDGRIKITAFAVNALGQPWFLDRMRRERRMGSIIGDIAVVAANVLELPEFEIKDVDEKSGIVTARPRMPIYSLE